MASASTGIDQVGRWWAKRSMRWKCDCGNSRAMCSAAAIGTSGEVYPAAGFVAEARARGIPTLEINLTPSDTAGAFDAVRLGPATEVVPAWVAQVLGA